MGNTVKTIYLKIGRKVYAITDKDLILDNGNCYQLDTQKKSSGFDSTSVIISKTLFNKLKAVQYVYTNEKLKEQAIQAHNHFDIRNEKLTYWKFNVDAMYEIEEYRNKPER